jgi:hypothetical protein
MTCSNITVFCGLLSGLSSSILENVADSSQIYMAANTRLPPSPAQMDPFYTQG